MTSKVGGIKALTNPSSKHHLLDILTLTTVILYRWRGSLFGYHQGHPLLHIALCKIEHILCIKLGSAYQFCTTKLLQPDSYPKSHSIFFEWLLNHLMYWL